MQKPLILFLFFGLSNLYAATGTFTSSAVCEYDKSKISHNKSDVVSLSFNCLSTIIKTNNNLFKLNTNSYGSSIAILIKSSSSMDLKSYNTIVSSSNPNDKIFSENIRKTGDVKSGGKGKSTIIGGTGKYNGITGECEYEIKYHPNNKTSGITTCKYSL